MVKSVKTIVVVLIASLIYITVLTVSWINSENKPLIIQKVDTALLDSIYNEILELEIQHPDIVFSQALLESNYASSDLFITNNNLFGMKDSGSRATTSDSIVNGYKWYPNWRESVIDYALLQMAFYRGLDEATYYQRLSENYAQDSKYIHKLKSVNYGLER